MDLDATQSAPAQESILLGPFGLFEPMGEGGMGVVWRGEHLAQRVPVAIKVITHEDARDPSLRAAFRAEVRAVAQMDHPAIVRVFEYGQVDAAAASASRGRLVEGSPFLVMELLRGGALNDQPPPTAWPMLQATLLELLDALGHAHARGLVHRDLKPRNVLFAGPENDRPGLRLTDFGIAHALGREDSGADEAEGASGTPYYMAPEQHHGQWRDFGPWTDLYSLGCIAWELASGRRPFEGVNLFSVVFGHLHREPEPLRPFFAVPPAFEDWARRLLEKDTRDRFRCAADAAFALREAEESRVWGVPPLPVSWRPSAHSRRPRVPLVGVGLGLHGMRAMPVLGRDAQMEACWGALREVWQTATPRLVLLEGGAGSGKSRLAAAFCDRAEEVGGATSLRVSHDPMPTRGSGLRDVIVRALGCQRMGRRELAARVADLLARDGVQDAYEAEALAEYLVSPDDWTAGSDGPQARAADPQERNALLQRFLRRGAARRPLVLHLDDVQWGSEALSLVEHLLSEPAIAVGPVLLLLCVRREALQARPLEARRLGSLLELPVALRLDVPPLDDDAARQLVGQVLGLEPRLADAVRERAAGRPQFAVQLVSDWVRRGLLLSSPSGFELDGELSAQLPADLDAIWDVRVQRLAQEHGSEVAASLEVAAALGLQVDAFEWNHACSELELHAQPDLIDRLVHEGLADATEGGWAFASVLLREALERQARGHSRWRDVHRACATMLSRRYPAGRPGLDERLGTHFVEARALEEGARVLGRAAEELQRLSEHRRAQGVARQRARALGLAGAPDADRRWGECMLVHANAELALGHLETALEAAVRLEDRAHGCHWPDLEAAAILVQGVVDRLEGDVARAELQLKEALELCPTADFGTRGRCTSYLASIRRQNCAFEESRALYEQARALYEQGRDPLGEAQARLGVATVAQELGELDEAEALYLELAHEFDGLGHLFGLAAAYNGLASVAHLRGDLPHAESGFRRAWDILERIGSPAAIATGLNVAFVHILQSDWQGVGRALHRIEAAGAASSQRPWLGQLLVYRLPGLAKSGDWLSFDQCLQSARERLRERAGPPQDIAEVAVIAGEICAERGEPHRARAALLIAREQWELLDEDASILEIDRRLGALPLG